FTPASIRRMAAQLIRVAAAVVDDPAAPIGSLPLLDAAEARLVLHDFAECALDFGPPTSLVAMFEAQVDRTPDRIAVVGGDGSLTYRARDQAANALAADLVARGLAPEERVGLAFAASSDCIISMLGIL